MPVRSDSRKTPSPVVKAPSQSETVVHHHLHYRTPPDAPFEPAGLLRGDAFGNGDRVGFLGPRRPKGRRLGGGVIDNGGGGLLGFGYVPDAPDHRDWSFTEVIKTQDYKASRATGAATRSGPDKAGKLPQGVDLRKGEAGDPFGPVLHQGEINNCTAHAVAAMSEYNFRQHFPWKPIQLSRFFLYNVARELLGIPWDGGATLRHTLKVMKKYGCFRLEDWPDTPETIWERPTIQDLDLAPFGGRLAYCRIDEQGVDGAATLTTLLEALADGCPVVFGFSPCRPFLELDDKNSRIEIPAADERVLDGHAVLAVGYEITGKSKDQKPSGYLLIRNSWGDGWGDAGYAWLSFEYVTRQLAYDFWMQYPVKEPADSPEKRSAGR